jgi:hypothetical protein
MLLCFEPYLDIKESETPDPERPIQKIAPVTVSCSFQGGSSIGRTGGFS